MFRYVIITTYILSMNPFCVSKSFNDFLFSDLTEDGPYGSVTGGSPWTDVNTFKENGQLTAIEMALAGGGILIAIRARYTGSFNLL